MDDLKKDHAEGPSPAATDVTSIVRQALEEFMQREQSKNEPAYKAELLEDFGVSAGTVTVIPFGINNSVPDTDLTPRQAKHRLIDCRMQHGKLAAV